MDLLRSEVHNKTDKSLGMFHDNYRSINDKGN